MLMGIDCEGSEKKSILYTNNSSTLFNDTLVLPSFILIFAKFLTNSSHFLQYRFMKFWLLHVPLWCIYHIERGFFSYQFAYIFPQFLEVKHRP